MEKSVFIFSITIYKMVDSIPGVSTFSFFTQKHMLSSQEVPSSAVVQTSPKGNFTSKIDFPPIFNSFFFRSCPFCHLTSNWTRCQSIPSLFSCNSNSYWKTFWNYFPCKMLWEKINWCQEVEGTPTRSPSSACPLRRNRFLTPKERSLQVPNLFPWILLCKQHSQKPSCLCE